MECAHALPASDVHGSFISHTPKMLLIIVQLATIFINGTSIPQTSWTMTAIGLRAAIEIGVHRRKPEGHKFTVEDELKKRTFW